MTDTDQGPSEDLPGEGGPDDRMERVWATRPGFIGWLGAVNHKQIGTRYIVTALIFFAVGGLLSVLMRIQLGGPDAGVVSPEVYNQLFTMHGTTMLFLFAVPVTEAVAMYFAPLLIGTRDMPLPRLNAFGYWVYLFGGVFLYSSMLTGQVPDSGWFAYVPLTGPEYSPGLNLDFWLLGVTFVEIAGVIAAIELIALVLKCRAPGMTASRIPVAVWASLVTGVMVVFAFPPLIAGSIMLELDRKAGTLIYDATAGGDPLLWQHIFWWFGHPEVYIILLPAIGVLSVIVPTFARTKLVGYTLVVASTVAIGIISFGLWVHHMYATGLPLLALSFFAAGSFVIAIPSGIQVFAWIATMWKGRVTWAAPMLWTAGAIFTFVGGGITGVMVAAVPFNWQAHDSYFVVGHFHYIIMGGVVLPIFAGLYYWVPKMSGRLYSTKQAAAAFWTTLVGVHVTFFPHHIVGLIGMPRRIYTYLPGLGWEVHNLISTVGAIASAIGFAWALGVVLHGAWRGPPAGPNPFGGGTLEWACASPPPPYNFRRLPVVADHDPLWRPVEEVPPRLVALQERLSEPANDRREILITSVLDAEPQRIITLPAHSLRPLLLAVIIAAGLFGVLIDAYALAIISAVVGVGAVVAFVWSRDDEPPADLRHDPPHAAPSGGDPA